MVIVCIVALCKANFLFLHDNHATASRGECKRRGAKCAVGDSPTSAVYTFVKALDVIELIYKVKVDIN